MRGQIDTGTDITFVRAHVVTGLKLARVGEVPIEGLTASQEAETFISYQYAVRVVITDVMDELVEVAELPDNQLPETELLIGRDILNQLFLGLWGPTTQGLMSSDLPQYPL